MSDTKVTIAEPTDDVAVYGDISMGDSVRARMQFLLSQNGMILTQTQFADAKAGALMTILGLVAIKGAAPAIVIIQNPLEMLSMAMVLVSLGFCLATIMPRFYGFRSEAIPDPKDRYTWLFIARDTYSGDLHGEFTRMSDFSTMLNAVANSNVGASKILVRKYQMLRWAFITGFIGCGLLLVATNT